MPIHMGKHTSGAYNASLFLDDIDEALRRANPGKPGVKAKRTLESVAFRRLADRENEVKQYRRHDRKAARLDEAWCPDPQQARARHECDETFIKIWKEIRLARRESQEAMKGLSEDELDRVSVAQLTRAWKQLTDEQWHEGLSLKFGPEVADVVMRKRAAQ